MITKITYTFLFFFTVFTAFGQRTLSGRTIDQFMDTAIGITIYDKDTTEIGQSDINGYFEIKLPKEIDKLIFTGLGYEWATLTITKECKNLEVILFMASTYDFMSPSKVDRLREKEFEKLSELHFQAFQKGLFKTEEPCVIRKFEPIKPRLDIIGRQMDLTKKQIKSTFKELEIGNVVKVPSETWSAYTDGTDYGCLVTGTIVGKNQKKRSYNLILKVTNNICRNEQATYNGEKVKIGDSITHNMKYYKIITE